MNQINHLKKVVKILRNNFEDDIETTFDWTWNLKNWTINFITDYDYESVTAYKAKNGITQWSEFITLEKRSKEWKELI